MKGIASPLSLTGQQQREPKNTSPSPHARRQEVPHDAAECPYCGYEFPREKPGVRPMALLFAALLVIPLAWILMRLFG